MRKFLIFIIIIIYYILYIYYFYFYYLNENINENDNIFVSALSTDFIVELVGKMLHPHPEKRPVIEEINARLKTSQFGDFFRELNRRPRFE